MQRILQKIGIVTLSLSTISTLTFAQSAEETVSYYREGVGVLSETNGTLEKQDTQNFSFSVRAGYHNWTDSKFIDTSWGAQFEIRAALGATPLDIVLRGHYTSTKYEDTYSTANDAYRYKKANVYEVVTYRFYDTKASAYGGSAQLWWNFRRSAVINPYIAVGAMYEKEEFETDYAYSQRFLMTYKWLASSWKSSGYGRMEDNDDGVAFVGRVGVEFSPDPFYARLEASYVSELYEDDAQAELSAMIGAKVTNNIRIDLSGSYFTDWKEYYVCAGFSVLF